MTSQAYTKKYLDSVYITYNDLSMMKETFYQGCNDIINMSSFDYDAKIITEVLASGFDLKDRFPDMETEVVSMIYNTLRSESCRKFLTQHKKFTEVAVMKAYQLISQSYNRPNDEEVQEARKIMQKFLYEAHDIIMSHEEDYEEDRDIDADKFDDRIRHNFDDEDIDC